MDESGFLLTPTVRRTWSPRACTPVVAHSMVRDKISVISGISVSPRGRRVGLYWHLASPNINMFEVCSFLRRIMRHLRGPVIVIWDGGKPHRGVAVKALLARHPRLLIERFPPYAPELNPDEGVWRHSKAELANGCPLGKDELRARLSRALLRQRKTPALLRGCIRHAGLSLFLR